MVLFIEMKANYYDLQHPEKIVMHFRAESWILPDNSVNTIAADAVVPHVVINNHATDHAG